MVTESTAGSSAGESARNRWSILAVVTMAQAAVALGNQGIFPLLPLIKETFTLHNAEVAFLSTANLVGSMSVVLVTGWLTDRLGIKRVLLLSLLTTGLVMILAGLVNSALQLTLIMFLVGLTYSGFTPSAAKAVNSWFHSAQKSTAMGIKQMGVTFGGIIASTTLPVLAYTLAPSWRGALFWAGIAIAFCGFLVLGGYQEKPSVTGNQIVPRPVYKHDLWELFRNKGLWSLGVFGLLMLGVQYGFLTYLVLYLTEEVHLSIITAALYLAFAQAGGAVGRIVWGVICDYFFAGKVRCVLSLAGALTGILTILILPALGLFPEWLALALIFILGFCCMGWNGVYMAGIVTIGGEARAATATGVAMTITYLGAFVGPPVFGYLVDFTQRYYIGWVYVGFSGLLAAVLVFLLLHESSGKQAFQTKTFKGCES